MNSKVWAVLLILLFVGGPTAFSAPVIVSFAPTAGTSGDPVQLSGSGFSAPNITIRFWNGSGGAIAKVIYVNSDSIMTVSVPNGIATGPISIQLGTATPTFTAEDFQAVGAGPFISGFTPEYGQVGDTVAISGVHLNKPLTVLFHGTKASEFSANADGTQITTRIPAGATTGSLSVTTSLGTRTSPGAFTVVGPGPLITGFSPLAGDGGVKVEVTGMHFTHASRVDFNGRPGVNLTANSDVFLQVQAPSGVTTGPITVYTPLGTATSVSNFFAQPAVTGFSPAGGRANTNVLITGASLLGTTAVFFNGILCPHFEVLSNTNLTAVVPDGTTTGTLRVVAPGGSAFSTGKFVVRPTFSSFSPAAGQVGTTVTIFGANLDAGSVSVRFGGVQAAVPTGVSFGQLTAKVPAGAVTSRLSVTTVDGSDTNSSLFFLPPSLASFSPTNGAPGTRIGMTGQNFLAASAVRFGAMDASSFTVSSNTFLSAVVPAGVITGPISVATPGGAVASSDLFYGPPAISSFVPIHGLPGANVTITGVNFLGGSVRFNGLNAPIVSLNNTQIVATVPNGSQTGRISVRGPGGTNTSSNSFVLDYLSDLQVSITNSQNPVTIGSNLTYTITIVNQGPAGARNIAFTNVLPAAVLLKSASISPPWAVTTNHNLIIGTSTNLESGAGKTFTLVVVPQAAGNITNTITVRSDYPDPNPADNTVSFESSVEPLALLSIGVSGARVRITWPVTLSNFALQYQDRVSAQAGWMPVATEPLIAGGSRFVVETNSFSSRFYRLSR